MQNSQQLPPNSKRFWAEEKNLDSIYTIFLKKISYTYNNSVNHTQSNCSQSGLDEPDLSVSTNQNNTSSKDDPKNESHFLPQTPVASQSRSRSNFFLKYKRRSSSVDKYSFVRSTRGSAADVNTSLGSQIEQKPIRSSNSVSAKSPKKQNGKKSLSGSRSESLFNNHDEKDTNIMSSTLNTDESCKTSSGKNVDIHKSSTDLSTSLNSESQFLQWETRQIKVLQAATLDHALKFILLIKFQSNGENSDVLSNPSDLSLDEERNNVAHIIHVLFCSYRIYTNPYELMLKLMDYSDLCRIEQYRFVMHYWMDNYPEDFDYIINPSNNSRQSDANSNGCSNNTSLASYNSIASYQSSIVSKQEVSDSEASTSQPSSQDPESLNQSMSDMSLKTPKKITLLDELLRLCKDEYIRKRATKLVEYRIANSKHHRNQSSSRLSNVKRSSILDMDSRYVAQQLTAIDLENFLNLKLYSLLEGTKSDKTVQKMIKNFNLLSKQVVVTILKSHSPHFVTSHWISIAINLRMIKNFNSLKAIIAGLTNESIYRLKNLIWSRISKANMANFKLLASIVDDVNNQTVLRQTQLVVEGTAKMNMDEDSFGTIPYLGTFLTDLNMIDARYPSYVPSPKDETSKLKLINFAKCAKQFEILTQVQLLQKNVIASLNALQRRTDFDDHNHSNQQLSQSQLKNMARPGIPRVSKLFDNWFFDVEVASMTDKQW